MNALEGWNQQQALREGWRLKKVFLRTVIFAEITGPFGFRKSAKDEFPPIRKWGDILAADAKALAFVRQKAREGSAYHIDALARTQLL